MIDMTTQVDPLLGLISRLGWHRVGFLGTDDVYGRSLFGALISATLTTSTEIIGSLFSASSSNVTGAAYNAWQYLLGQQCRVFILHALLTPAKVALEAALSLNILDNPNVFNHLTSHAYLCISAHHIIMV
jgi:quinol-cytochrome oxidoreductase complex cytochrome b subunit